MTRGQCMCWLRQEAVICEAWLKFSWAWPSETGNLSLRCPLLRHLSFTLPPSLHLILSLSVRVPFVLPFAAPLIGSSSSLVERERLFNVETALHLLSLSYKETVGCQYRRLNTEPLICCIVFCLSSVQLARMTAACVVRLLLVLTEEQLWFSSSLQLPKCCQKPQNQRSHSDVHVIWKLRIVLTSVFFLLHSVWLSGLFKRPFTSKTRCKGWRRFSAFFFFFFAELVSHGKTDDLTCSWLDNQICSCFHLETVWGFLSVQRAALIALHRLVQPNPVQSQPGEEKNP